MLGCNLAPKCKKTTRKRRVGQSITAPYLAPQFMSKHQSTSPEALGFSMPAEWEPHEATWLGWPHNETDWPGKLDTIRWVYGEIARKLTVGEVVRLLVNSKAQERLARGYLKSARADMGRIKFVVH